MFNRSNSLCNESISNYHSDGLTYYQNSDHGKQYRSRLTTIALKEGRGAILALSISKVAIVLNFELSVLQHGYTKSYFDREKVKPRPVKVRASEVVIIQPVQRPDKGKLQKMPVARPNLRRSDA